MLIKCWQHYTHRCSFVKKPFNREPEMTYERVICDLIGRISAVYSLRVFSTMAAVVCCNFWSME
jgi:hypothetical protein